ncbi:MAG: hypothetical protein R3F55_11410 [Alphaproteobacteria bacterium]
MTMAGADRQLRQAARRRGLRAERLAAWWLRLKGYAIVAADVRTPAGQRSTWSPRRGGVRPWSRSSSAATPTAR